MATTATLTLKDTSNTVATTTHQQPQARPSLFPRSPLSQQSLLLLLGPHALPLHHLRLRRVSLTLHPAQRDPRVPTTCQVLHVWGSKRDRITAPVVVSLHLLVLRRPMRARDLRLQPLNCRPVVHPLLLPFATEREELLQLPSGAGIEIAFSLAVREQGAYVQVFRGRLKALYRHLGRKRCVECKVEVA